MVREPHGEFGPTSHQPNSFGAALETLAQIHYRQVSQLEGELTTLRSRLVNPASFSPGLQEQQDSRQAVQVVPPADTSPDLTRANTVETCSDGVGLGMAQREDTVSSTNQRNVCSDATARWVVLVQGAVQLSLTDPGKKVSKLSTHECLLLPMWTIGQRCSDIISKEKGGAGGIPIDPGCSNDDITVRRYGDELRESRSCAQPFIIHPNSPGRLLWGAIGMLCLVYDMLMIPLFVFLIPKTQGFWEVLEVGSLAYWMFDCVLQFFIGYHSLGTIDMRPHRVARKYLVTWFSPDISILIVDLALFISEEMQSQKNESLSTQAVNVGSTSFRLLRLSRLIRLIRLLRVHKLQELGNLLLCRINSQHLLLVLTIARQVAVIIIFNHYVACFWLGIALWNASGEHTWVKEVQVEDESSVYQYVLSLHWSLTQFSPSTNNIAPQNWRERMFAVAVVMLALVIFSSFVSSVTNAVNRLRTINMEWVQEESRVKEFIRSRCLSTNLGVDIQHFIQLSQRKRLKKVYEVQIHSFTGLPESMKLRLHDEMFLPVLTCSAIFQGVIHEDRYASMMICHRAMSETTYIPCQDVFMEGTHAKHIFIVRSGSLTYSTSADKVLVNPDHWISFLALWIDWLHTGQLTAFSSTELVVIDCHALQQVVLASGGRVLIFLRRFAAFLVGLVEAKIEMGATITDLSLPEKETQELAIRVLKLCGMTEGEINLSRLSRAGQRINGQRSLLRSLSKSMVGIFPNTGTTR